MLRRFFTFLLLFLFLSCVSGPFFQSQRSPGPGFGFESKGTGRNNSRSEYKPYYTVVFGTVEEVEDLLKAGQDPNKIKHPPWETSWDHRNPLWLVAGDYEMAKLFIDYGADVTGRPYIAKIMGIHVIISERFPKGVLLTHGGGDYEKDVYEKTKLFLEAGADPNMRGTGSSIPVLLISTESNYRRWFNKNGNLAINTAIRFNAFSIVELLLSYGAILDERSRNMAKKATELSGGHTDMEDYIQAVWEKQQAERVKKSTTTTKGGGL
jgi:ankyrin repeat protein